MESLNVGKLNSYFGAGVVLKGKLKFKGILRMDGAFEGEVTAGETFIVGKTGSVKADINTDNLFNFGGVEGNVVANSKISLHEDSSLSGNITSPILVTEELAYFEGSCKMPKEKRLQKGKHDPLDSLSHPISSAIDSPSEFVEGGVIRIASIVAVIALLAGGVFFLGGDNLLGSLKVDSTPEPAHEAMATPPLSVDEHVVKEHTPKVESPGVIQKVKPKPEPKAPSREAVISEEEKLAKNVEQDSGDTASWLKLATLKLKAKEYSEVLQILQRAVEANPQDVKVLGLAADTFQTVGRESIAQIHYTKIGEIDSGSIVAQVNRAHESMESGALDKATKEFVAVLKQAPGNHRARLGLATVYSKVEQNEKATAECMRILQASKNYAPALNRLAWIYAKQGVRLREAKVLSQRSIKIFDDIPGYLDTLSEINHQMGDHDNAINLINKAIALAPNEPYYERQLFKFKRAKNLAK